MTKAAAPRGALQKVGGARIARAAERSRAAREKADLALTPAERLTQALELADLCAELAVAGRKALRKDA